MERVEGFGFGDQGLGSMTEGTKIRDTGCWALDAAVRVLKDVRVPPRQGTVTVDMIPIMENHVINCVETMIKGLGI